MSNICYEKLVRPDRIHGSLYWDPSVFEEELARIWYSQWVYIGHESEVSEPGGYVRKQLGLQPVLLTRDLGGGINVLFNRCSHLANLVCHQESGVTKSMQCPFHGWTFALDGKNMGVPYPQGYGPSFDKTQHSLAAPSQVASHRGFVFANLATGGPSLTEFLGPAAAALDRLCDLSPEGEIELTAGWLRHRTSANWKLGHEAALDGYHPRFVHRALISLTQDTMFEQGTDSGDGVVRSFKYGHGDVDITSHYRASGQPLKWVGSTPGRMPEYVAALERRHGSASAEQMLIDGPPHVMISPNLFVADLFIMVLQPLSPTLHVQLETPIQWKGAPELNRHNIRQTNASIGPAGMVLADDVAMMERNQKGLEAGQPEWMLRTRGAHRRKFHPDGTSVSQVTDDAGILGFWEHYRTLMTIA